jgi:hypothetical protein
VTRIFLSYSHRDEALRAELDKHFALLKRQGLLDLWTDHRISPGDEINPAVSEALESADIVLLLVSADFIASDYCYGVEMQRAMERHGRSECVVIPVILRACDWKSAPFGKLKALPTDGRPVMKWPSLDEACEDVVRQVRTLLEKAAGMGQPPPPQESPRPAGSHPAPEQVTKPVVRSSNLSLPRTFTDQDKHDFTQSSFDFIREYFDESLRELQARNQEVQARMTVQSPTSFTAVLFRAGRRVAGCHIRLGGMMRMGSILFSANENPSDNSFNESLSVEADAQVLYLEATMGRITRHVAPKLTQEGAAEHLWSMLITPLQQQAF